MTDKNEKPNGEMTNEKAVGLNIKELYDRTMQYTFPLVQL